MKFSEKLMNLRRSKGWSQDEFAQQIGVTRQTVSKWELDQTVPDMNKLIDISKVFGISLDELVNDMEDSSSENTYEEGIRENPVKNASNDSIVKILIIVIVIGCIIGGIVWIKQKNDEKNAQILSDTMNQLGTTATDIVNQFGSTATNIINKEENNDMNAASNMFSEMSNSIADVYGKQSNKIMEDFNNKSEEYKRETTSMEEENKKFAFNMRLKNMQGTQSEFMLSQDLDEVVTSNKTNKNHLIEVTYNGITSTEEDDIVAIKHSLKDGNKYEVSVDYDANGYINKITIKDI